MQSDEAIDRRVLGGAVFRSLRLLFLVSTFLLSACAKRADEPVPAFVSHIESIESPAGKVYVLGESTRIGQVLLIHGLTVDHGQYFHGQQARVVEKFWKMGFQVLLIDLPYTVAPPPYDELRKDLANTMT